MEFLKKATNYLVNKIKETVYSVDIEKVHKMLDILHNGIGNRQVSTTGTGRSNDSFLYADDYLINSYYFNAVSCNDVNHRHLKSGNILLFNSRTASTKSRVFNNVLAAVMKGLTTTGFSSNKSIENIVDNLVLIDTGEHNGLFAPMGTEYEQITAFLYACVGYSFSRINRYEVFEQTRDKLINSLLENSEYFLKQEDNIGKFHESILKRFNTENVVFWQGFGMNNPRVARTRYGHLPPLNVRSITNYWAHKSKNDLVNIVTGSGDVENNPYLKVIIDDAINEEIGIFLFTGFENTKLEEYIKDYEGYEGKIVIHGRSKKTSNFKKFELDYVPFFEINAYIVLDALLAYIAYKNNISESMMKATHRDPDLE